MFTVKTSEHVIYEVNCHIRNWVTDLGRVLQVVTSGDVIKVDSSDKKRMAINALSRMNKEGVKVVSSTDIMPKTCRKHKIEFNGIRCPKCSAPPVIKKEAEDGPGVSEATLAPDLIRQVDEKGGLFVNVHNKKDEG